LDTKDIEAILDSGLTESNYPLCILLKKAKANDAWILELPVEGEEQEEWENV
jgi:hypothetical protein